MIQSITEIVCNVCGKTVRIGSGPAKPAPPINWAEWVIEQPAQSPKHVSTKSTVHVCDVCCEEVRIHTGR